MTDVESLLREAIVQGTDGVPPTDLVERVHERARARRRRTTALAAGLSAATVAVVAIATAQFTGPDQAKRAPITGGTPTAAETVAADPGWRWESWHDVQVQVPDDWTWGSRTQWCTMNSRTDGWMLPLVWRSDMPETKARCSDPVQSYGLTFGSSGLVDLAVPSGSIWQYGDQGVYPAGAWLSIVIAGDVAVWVAAPDRATAERVVESVDLFQGASAVDANGCMAKAGRASGRLEAQPGTVSVCRYMDGFWLQQSERLGGTDAAAAVAALDAAPVIDTVPCPLEKVPPPTIELVTSEGVAQLTLGHSCQGAYWQGAKHALTAELMYWAISPGFLGAVPGDIPLPDTLRTGPLG